MKRITKLIFALAMLAVMSGCAMQPERTGASFNSFCTLAGAVVGGGGTAAVTLAAGPIGAGVFVGALLGTLACADDTPAPQPVAATPPPAPVPVRELDSDGDGVMDRSDRCPDTPRGSSVNAYGCPDILLVLTGINFKFDSSRIEPDSERILDQAVNTLNKVDPVDVRIEGHTDSIGSDAYNMKLSDRRANAVRDYLIGRGINGARLSTDGKGESQPVAPNDTDAGRYQNRRVEFHVVGDGRVSMNADYSGDSNLAAQNWTSPPTGDQPASVQHSGGSNIAAQTWSGDEPQPLSSSADMSIPTWKRLDQVVVRY